LTRITPLGSSLCVCVTRVRAHTGVDISFVKADDIGILRDIEQFYGTQIDEMPMNGVCV